MPMRVGHLEAFKYETDNTNWGLHMVSDNPPIWYAGLITSEAAAKRLAACYNFCIGLSTEAIENCGYENLSALLEVEAELFEKYQAEIDYQLESASANPFDEERQLWEGDNEELTDHMALIAVLRGVITPTGE